jgi:hypothetical protein
MSGALSDERSGLSFIMYNVQYIFILHTILPQQYSIYENVYREFPCFELLPVFSIRNTRTALLLNRNSELSTLKNIRNNYIE